MLRVINRFGLARAAVMCGIYGASCVMVEGQDGKIVIAHRGASGYLPEHTLEAKALAYGMGADYLEQDVVLSKDDWPLVLHDIHLDTVTNVAQVFPDRARPDGRYYAIDFTLDEIRRLNVNERISLETGQAVYPKRFPIGTSRFRVSTLQEEIELVQGLNKSTGKNVGIYPELKSPAWHRSRGKDLGKIVIDQLHKYGYRDRSDNVYVQCFEPDELKRLRNNLHVKLKLVQLLGEDEWNDPSLFLGTTPAERLKSVSRYADGIGPSINMLVRGIDRDGKLLTTSLVRDAHQAGLTVHAYTVRADQLPNYAEDFNRLLSIFLVDLGVDGVFTDFPDRTVRFTTERKSAQRSSN